MSPSASLGPELVNVDNLPNEVLACIFRHPSPHDLTSAVRVCRHWKAVAERLLYRDIFVSDIDLPFYNTTKCCQTIISHSHFARNLTRLCVRWSTRHFDHPSLGAVLSHLSAVINLSTNLKSLKLHLGLPYYRDCGSLAGRLRLPTGDTTFCPLRPPSPHAVNGLPQSHLVQFLHNTPSIQHLQIPRDHDKFSLNPHDFPSLTSFGGPSSVAAKILPGRPIRSLTPFGKKTITNHELSATARITVPLRHLDLSEMPIGERLLVLRKISMHFAMLESVRVKLLQHTVGFLPYTWMQRRVKRLLRSFHHLTTFDLSPTTLDLDLSDSTTERSTCHSWPSGCPTLRRVIFPSDTEWPYGEDKDDWVPRALEESEK